MKVSVKLVGYFEIIDEQKYTYEINYEDEYIFNFEIFKKKFVSYGIISNDELDVCMAISNSKNLKKESIIDNTNTNYNIYIYCLNQDVKNKLINIYKCYGKKLLYNLEEKVNSSWRSTEQNICEDTSQNLLEHENIIDYKPNFELFNNNDFINLIRIYKIKPDIFKDFYKFISSRETDEGSRSLNVCSDSECTLTNRNASEDVTLFSGAQAKENDSNLECIKKYKFNITDDYIRESLQKNNNNLGLTLKYILSYEVYCK